MERNKEINKKRKRGKKENSAAKDGKQILGKKTERNNKI
jgi:hypothetical protein